MFLRPVEYYVNRFHDKQEKAWLAYKSGLDLVLPWGRRSGKTDFVAETFIEDIEENGKDCLYVALTQEQAFSIFWPKLEQRLNNSRHWKPNLARHEFRHLPSRAKISLKGMELGKNRLRGDAKRLICCDEYAFYKDPSVIKEVFIPMLADYNGQIFYMSSPNGKNHMYELEDKAKSEPDRFFTSKCTMFDNQFMSNDGRMKMISEYTGPDDPLYRQEILGEYVVLEGMAFAIDAPTYTVNTWDKADLDHSIHWRGVDHGFNPDPTACLWMAYNHRKGYFLIYNEYRQSKLLIQQHADIINKTESYDFRDTISDIDPQIIAEYDAIGLTMTPAHKYDKKARVLRIVNALKTGKLKIAKNCTMLLNEMQNYVWDQDGNDHLIDSLIYAYTNTEVPEKPKPEEPIIPTRTIIQDRFTQDFGED